MLPFPSTSYLQKQEIFAKHILLISSGIQFIAHTFLFFNGMCFVLSPAVSNFLQVQLLKP